LDCIGDYGGKDFIAEYMKRRFKLGLRTPQTVGLGGLAKDMLELVNVRIPRRTGILERRKLHVFADASESAYVAAVYLRGIGL